MGKIDLKIEMSDEQMAKVKVVEVRIKKSSKSVKEDAEERQGKSEKTELKSGIDSSFGGDF